MATSDLDEGMPSHFMVNATDIESKDRLRIFTGVFNPDYVERERIEFRQDQDEFDDMIGQDEFDDMIGPYFVEMEQLLHCTGRFSGLEYTAVFKDKKKAKKAKKAKTKKEILGVNLSFASKTKKGIRYEVTRSGYPGLYNYALL